MIWWLLAVAVAINMAGFLAAYFLRSDKLTDFSYGSSFLILAAAALGANQNSKTKDLIVFIVVLWGVRLTGFLLVRVIKAKKDRRFDGVRDNFWKFGAFWVGQGILAWVIMLPVLFLLNNNLTAHGLKPLAAVGALISLIGLVIETTADLQKFRFNQDPKNKNKWIENGLWKFSRHPNYFGEILVWVGTYIYCFSYISSAQRIVGLASPVSITLMLLFVTGIPKLEKYADQKWGNNKDYKSYKQHTSMLVPLPNKH